MNRINKIISDSYFKDLSEHENTCSILLIGSLLRNDYIEGWSDIDLILVSNDVSVEYYDLVNKFTTSVSKSTKTKVGCEIVDPLHLSKAIQLDSCPGTMVKFAKNLHKESLVWERGVLYKKQNLEVPMFDIATIDTRSLLEYSQGVVGYMNKMMLSNYDSVKNKFVLRKIIKNCLLLIQTCLLVETHELVLDFALSSSKFKKNRSYNLDTLERSFDKRHIWETINDNDIERSEIDDNWKLFTTLSSYIIEKC